MEHFKLRYLLCDEFLCDEVAFLVSLMQFLNNFNAHAVALAPSDRANVCREKLLL